MSQEELQDIAENEIAVQPKKPAADQPVTDTTDVTPAKGEAEGTGTTAPEEADDDDDDDTPIHGFKPRGKAGGGIAGGNKKR